MVTQEHSLKKLPPPSEGLIGLEEYVVKAIQVSDRGALTRAAGQLDRDWKSLDHQLDDHDGYLEESDSAAGVPDRWLISEQENIEDLQNDIAFALRVYERLDTVYEALGRVGQVNG